MNSAFLQKYQLCKLLCTLFFNIVFVAPPPADRRVDRHDSVERIKTDIVKKRSEFLGLDVEESDEYHMIKIGK